MQPTGGKRPPSINTSVLTVHFYTNVVAPELLGRAGNRLGDVREMLRKARRDVIEH